MNEEKLDNMWEVQRRFYETIRKEKSHMTEQQFCHSLVMHLYTEVNELLQGIGGPWKSHISETTELRRSQVLAEVVDIAKLSWEIAIAAGVTSDEFFDAFIHKSIVVEWRRSNEKFLDILKSNKEPVVVFDFDGVLVYYPEEFLKFVDARVPMMACSIDRLKSPDDLWTQIGVPLERYQELKREFIEGGGLRRLPMIVQAFALIEWLKQRGYRVVIVTSRDKSSLEKMELDSYRWLEDHCVEDLIDGIYFALDKARFIKEHFESVVLVVEDHALEVERLKEAGIPAVCLKRPYNANGVTFDDIKNIIVSKEMKHGS